MWKTVLHKRLLRVFKEVGEKESGSRELNESEVKTTNILSDPYFFPVTTTSGFTTGNILSMRHFEIFLSTCDSGNS